MKRGGDPLSEAIVSGEALAAEPARRRSRFWPAVLAVTLLLAAVGVGFLAGLRAGESSPALFHRLTFRRGRVLSARFAPDGKTVLYGGKWEGDPLGIFSTRPESPESRPVGFPGASLFAISSSGEMALGLGCRGLWSGCKATLARVGLTGSAPRELLEDVDWADWSPDGKDLAVVRSVAGKSRIEFPAGNALYETSGWLSHPRVSPDGKLVAFLDHPTLADDRGSVDVVDLTGKKQVLSSGWRSAYGLSWSADGREVWFTAGKAGMNSVLHAVRLSGEDRVVVGAPGQLFLQDISRDGQVLVTQEARRSEIIGLSPGETKERYLTWLDSSVVTDLSDDGKTILFFESGEAGGAVPATYLRKTDGSAAVRLGEGIGTALSPDGKWVAAMTNTSPRQLALLPTGPGESRPITHDAIDHGWAIWFPDGKRILFEGNDANRGPQLYVQDVEAGTSRAVTRAGFGFRIDWSAISPDGRFIGARGADRKGYLCLVDGGADSPPRLIPGLAVGDSPIRWSGDGRSLYVRGAEDFPARVYRVDALTGHKSLWKEFAPPDSSGLFRITRVRVTPDGKSYVFGYISILSDLYLVEGLK